MDGRQGSVEAVKVVNLKSLLYTTQFQIRRWLTGKYFGVFPGSQTSIDPAAFSPHRVLIVVAGLIGDSVMCLPAIREARRLWPDARIVLLGRTHQKELFLGCTEIDEFYVCDADAFSLRRSHEIEALKKWLIERQFDISVVLLTNEFGPILSRAGIPIRIGIQGTALDTCFTHTYDIGSPRTWGANERLNALRCIGYQVACEKPVMGVYPEARQIVTHKLASFGLTTGEPFAVLHPFGSTPRQWWKFEMISTLAARLRDDFGLRTVLVGRSYDLNGVKANPVFGRMDESVINLFGQISLSELVALVDAAQLVVTTDSGPFHIAGALGKTVVGLFREARPEHANAYPATNIIFGKNSSCDRRCRWDRCSANPCGQMQSITVEEIIDSAGHLLNGRPAGTPTYSLTCKS